jgi:hypothetical protein
MGEPPVAPPPLRTVLATMTTPIAWPTRGIRWRVGGVDYQEDNINQGSRATRGRGLGRTIGWICRVDKSTDFVVAEDCGPPGAQRRPETARNDAAVLLNQQND